MKRKEDPKREATRAERDRASIWVEILSKGIAATLQAEGEGRYDSPIHIRQILKLADENLLPAVQTLEAAEEAYRPYWSHRLSRVYPAKKPKTAAKKKAAA